MKCMSFLFILVVSTAVTAADAFMDEAEGGLPNGGKIWVLLVAGSRGYYNYRHQADICHAYHVSYDNFGFMVLDTKKCTESSF